jgi:phosphatidylethanolamine/phosphatidyl-N-methylethanolamine N-methyltransferase
MREAVERDRNYWERHAARYDRSLGPLGRPLPRMLELVGAAVAGKGRALELAAGTGLVTPTLAGAAREVVATDYAAAMVEQLRATVERRRLGNVRCEQADIYALPFETASFDAVVAANVLHLVPDLGGALAAMRRVLKPGGVLVVPTFCHDETALSWIVSRVLALTGFPGHRRFTARSLGQALAAAGIDVGRSETLPGLIPICYVDGVPRPLAA